MLVVVAFVVAGSTGVVSTDAAGIAVGSAEFVADYYRYLYDYFVR
jgi:hypothetical protein